MIPPEVKVCVIGIRGFPGVQGGAEKHAEELYPRLAALGVRPTVFARASYFPPARRPTEWHGVSFVYLRAPRRRHLEAFCHSFAAALRVGRLRREVDLVHVHNIGPALCLPLLKCAGLKTVLTYHSPNYEHKQWGPIARWVLRLGERVGLRYADAVVTVSESLRRRLTDRYPGRTIVHIPNGVAPPERLPPGETLRRWNLEPGRYFFAACRLVDGKGLEDLIQAFARLRRTDVLLVIAGDADHETDYSRSIKKTASETPGVVLVGMLTGPPLAELYAQAGLFVLPSYSEGLPLSLLEAMSAGAPVLASDIEANRELGLRPSRYYPVGSVSDLAAKMDELISLGLPPDEALEIQAMLARDYDWTEVARRTRDLFAHVAGPSIARHSPIP